MIINAEIISQPDSGIYTEKIYDISNPWNSLDWTWVKFLNDDYTEWCGEFRGFPRNVAFSLKYNIVLVLTSDYLYQIDCASAKILEYEFQHQYKNLTAIPTGEFLLSDDYKIYIARTSSLKDMQIIKSPLEMDNIRFDSWHDNKLKISCEEFLNWGNNVELEFSSDTMELSILKSNKPFPKLSLILIVIGVRDWVALCYQNLLNSHLKMMK